MSRTKFAYFFIAFIPYLILIGCGSSSATLPAAPSNVQTFVSSGKISVTWTNNSALATGFNIYREAVADVSSLAFEKIGEVGAGVSSFEDTSFSVGVSYRYGVTAKSAEGESARTETETPVKVDNKPPLIQDFSVTSSLSVATLTASVSDADGDVADVVVDWGDGQTDTLTSGFENIELEHSYSSFGIYSVTLTAKDTNGGEATKTTDLELSDFPTAGLIAEFLSLNRQEDSVRILVDSSGQGNDGYLNTSGSTELEAATDRFGLAEGAFDFRGKDAGQASVMEIRSSEADGALPYGEDYSLVLWMEGSRFGYLIGPKDETNVFNSAGLMKQQSASEVTFEVPLANAGAGFTLSDSNPPNAEWTFYAVTIERTASSATIKLYRDGALVDEGTLADAGPNVLPTESPVIVGARANYTGGGGGLDFQGKLDDIRVYDRVLSAGEVAALYGENGWTGNP